MKFTPFAASIFALALFSTPMLAQDAPVDPQQPAAEQPAVAAPAAEAAVPQEILDFIANSQNLTELQPKQLVNTIRQAKRYARVDGLPEDVKTKLSEISKAAQQEIAAREQQPAEKQPEPQKQAENPPAAEAPAAEAPAAPAPAAQAPAAEAPVDTPPPAAAEQQAQAAPAEPEIPAEVTALLGDTRPATELSVEELNSRAKQARRYAKMKALPADIRQQLQAMADAAHEEFVSRQAQAKQKEQAQVPTEQPPAPPVEQPPAPAEQPPAAPAEQPPAAPVEQPAPAPAQPATPPAAAATEVPADVMNLLADTRPATELSVDELKNRLKQSRQLSKTQGLSPETSAQLEELGKAARAELITRDQQAAQGTAPVAPAAPDAAPAAPDAAPAAPDAAAQPPAATAETKVPPPPPAIIEQAPTAPLPPAPPPVAKVETPPPAPAVAPVAVDKAQAQKLDGNAGTPEAEAKAKAILDDTRAAEQLNDQDLRARLDGIRELMAGNELSRDTERALRQKLKAEREILRTRVAQAEAAPQPPAQPPAQNAPPPQPGTANPPPAQQGANNAPPPPPPSTARPPRTHENDTNINLSFEVILNDRRPSDDLKDYELRRRLEVYRQATYDRRYQEEERAYWRAVMERDQYQLQQRLLRERRAREAELQAQYDAGQYDYRLDDQQYDPGQDNQEDVYADEVDDTELQQVLLAPPRKKITRKYTVKEVEASPQLREALPRVELDTVHFGFNEAFVRAEEVSNLDRLGATMERILKAHPREVFLIEGHTDAVGSDAANLALSRQRSEAIKKALITYYVIPDKNLKTVGYGERYLKIPTAEAEQENRRVSVSRATALIGQAAE